MHNSAILLISCPDRKGIVATVADFVYRHNGNIICADEHGDEESNLFLLRVEFDAADFDFDSCQFSDCFAPIARDFQMDWRLAHSADRPRIVHEQRSRLPARSVYGCPMGHLLCYGIIIPGLPRNHKPAAVRVISGLAVPHRVRPAATRSSQFDEATFGVRMRASSPIGQRFRQQSVCHSISLPC